MTVVSGDDGERKAERQSSHDFDTPTETRSRNGTRTKHLDGLRGLAALLVFLHHITPDMTMDVHEYGYGQSGQHWHLTSLPIIRLIWSGGNAAVPIFLVISGYVLSIGPLKRSGSGRRKHLLESAARRPVRLYAPALAISFLHGLLLHVPGLMIFNRNTTPYPQQDLIDELSLLLESLPFFNPFTVNGAGVQFPYNVVYWTLPVELRGSLMIYGLLFVFPIGMFKSNRASVILSVAILLAGYMALRLTASWTMVCFLWGLAVAVMDTSSVERYEDDAVTSSSILPFNSAKSKGFTRPHGSLPPFFAWICFLTGLYLLSEPGYTQHRYSQDTPGWQWLAAQTPASFGDTDFYRYWPTIGSLCVVYGILRIRSIQRFFESRPLQFLGRISFSLYLIHLPCMQIFADRFRSILGGVTSPMLVGTIWDHTLTISDAGPPGLSLRYMTMIAMTLPIILLMAWTATIAIDLPSVRLSKCLTKKLRLR